MNINSSLDSEFEVGPEDNYWNDKNGSNLFHNDSTKSNLWDGLFSPEEPPNEGFHNLANSTQKEDMPETSTQKADQQLQKQSKCLGNGMELLKDLTISPSSSQHIEIETTLTPSFDKKVSLHSSSDVTTSSKSVISTHKSSNSFESQTASEMTVHLDYARLKTEHRKLRKYFENAHEGRYKSPPIIETIRRLGRCEPVTLDLYKSKEEKMHLLDSALEHGDHDVVIPILLFLKNTLVNQLFRQCLIEKPAAADYYINYLKESGETQELLDTLFGLGQIADAAVLEFSIACRFKDPKRKLEALKNCLLGGFSHPQLTNEKKHLEEWIAILETHVIQR